MLETRSDHPFSRTWWIVPDRILGGCYPGDPDPNSAAAKVKALFAAGVRSILCLQPAAERGRGGQPFTPYHQAWETLGRDHGETVT